LNSKPLSFCSAKEIACNPLGTSLRFKYAFYVILAMQTVPVRMFLTKRAELHTITIEAKNEKEKTI